MKNILPIAIFFCSLLTSIGTLSAQNSTNKSAAVQKLLDKKIQHNKTLGFGYSVQIYYGNETTAKKIHEKRKN